MLTRHTAILATAGLLAVIFVLDYLVGSEINLWVLYLAPIAFGSIAFGTRNGYWLAVGATGLLWFASFLLSPSTKGLIAVLIDRGSSGITYFLFAFLVGQVRAAIAREESGIKVVSFAPVTLIPS